ncbi:MAG: dihydrolipoyl dehydrogenase, partial [Rhodobacteraceae bacterium]|nr:dihydrolipoyl dehydrogenase [Paracoccaceae bacterium]
TPKRMPKKLLVIGSGAIGIEFASFYNTLGADTTVVEVMDRVLPVEDEEISKFAKKQFEKQGMKIREKAMVKKLDRGNGKVTAHIEQGGKTKTEEFDTVISAVGIVGNVEDLGLEALGVTIDRTHVVTDEYCRTGVDGLFAVKVGRFPFIGNGKAIALGEPEGMVKTIFDEKTGELLGAHMVGAEVTEMIQGYVIGQQLETTEEDLMHTVFPHPTLSEMMHESVLDAYGRVIHM